MNIWLHALLASAVVGLVVAFLRAATLGDVVQRYSARTTADRGQSNVGAVVDAMAGDKRGNGLAKNLAEPAFWRIVFGLWFAITAVGFAACAVLIWTM